jgi:hypothetical protein
MEKYAEIDCIMSSNVTPQTRKLRTKWTIEAAQDLQVNGFLYKPLDIGIFVFIAKNVQAYSSEEWQTDLSQIIDFNSNIYTICNLKTGVESKQFLGNIREATPEEIVRWKNSHSL